jgi:hypothetical protein
MTALEPDRDLIEQFIDAIFRRASPEGFVSLRSFFEDEDKVLSTTAVAFSGANRFHFLADNAENYARTAAQSSRSAVFAPPLATFSDRHRARESDVLEGLALSVELDEHPQEARQKLEALLGPATAIVRSGGVWINGGAAAEDKLHGHWRLRAPARGDDALKKLKRARGIATRLAGGDASNVPPCHPIRWPGSWHRKKEPRMCAIDTIYPDVEIDLDDALAKLTAAAPEPEPGPDPDGDPSGGGNEWPALYDAIVSGRSFHEPLVRLAAMSVASRMSDAAAVNSLRGIMSLCVNKRPEWQARYDSIPRYVRSAREKFGKAQQQAKPKAPLTAAEGLQAMAFDPIKYVVPGVIVEGLTLLAGKPKIGKSWLLLHAAIAVSRGGFTLGEIHCPEGDVLYCALEDNLRRLKSRMGRLITDPNEQWPKRLVFQCEMPRLSQGGLGVLKDWICNAPDPRLIVIDTLAMVKAPRGKDANAYDADYAALVDLRAFAAEHHVSVVVVHHLRKMDADDAFDTVSGTLGLTGAPDSILILKRDGSGNIVLHGRGRDLSDIEVAMMFNKEACTWTIMGDAAQFRNDTRRGAVLAAMAELGEASAGEIAAVARMKVNSVTQTLVRLVRDGAVRRVERGKYTLTGLAA